MPAGCQIILAHNGVSMGVSGYPTVTINCSYVILAAMPNQRIRFGIGTGKLISTIVMYHLALFKTCFNIMLQKQTDPGLVKGLWKGGGALHF